MLERYKEARDIIDKCITLCGKLKLDYLKAKLKLLLASVCKKLKYKDDQILSQLVKAQELFEVAKHCEGLGEVFFFKGLAHLQRF